jgi:hypothetical protein
MVYVSANEKAVSLNLHRYAEVGEDLVGRGEVAITVGPCTCFNPAGHIALRKRP